MNGDGCRVDHPETRAVLDQDGAGSETLVAAAVVLEDGESFGHLSQQGFDLWLGVGLSVECAGIDILCERAMGVLPKTCDAVVFGTKRVVLAWFVFWVWCVLLTRLVR